MESIVGLLGNGLIAAAMLAWLTFILVPSMQKERKEQQEAFTEELKEERSAREKQRQSLDTMTVAFVKSSAEQTNAIEQLVTKIDAQHQWSREAVHELKQAVTHKND